MGFNVNPYVLRPKASAKVVFGNVNVGKCTVQRVLLSILLCALFVVRGAHAWDFHAGPLFDQFPLTLDSGHRTELIGPLLYYEQKDTQRIWAVPPLLSYTVDPATDFAEFDLGYPFISYDRYGRQYRLQIF